MKTATQPQQMVYRLTNNKNLGEQAVEILCGQTRKAQRVLGEYEIDPVNAVHTARQTFKRIRSLLHLVRDSNPYMFAVENRCFRDLGRQLAAARDVDAMQEARSRLKELPAGEHQSATRLLKRWFKMQDVVATGEQIDHRTAVYAVLESLRVAEDRFRRLDLTGVTRGQLLARLGITRLEFGHCYRQAVLKDTPDAYHEWRKATKRLNDQQRLCAALDKSRSDGTHQLLNAIATTLGEHQDTIILYKYFLAAGGNLTADERAQLVSLFEYWMRTYRDAAGEQMLKLSGPT